jgi:hypothetical protein
MSWKFEPNRMQPELLVQFKESYGAWNILRTWSCLCVPQEGQDTWLTAYVTKTTLVSTALLRLLWQGSQALTAVVMKFYVLGHNAMYSCHLLSSWFLARLILRPWRWRRKVDWISTDYKALCLRRYNSSNKQPTVVKEIDVFPWKLNLCINGIVIIMVSVYLQAEVDVHRKWNCHMPFSSGDAT